ncbi:MAG: LPS export ABC transporter periplasmic protein LptC [Candidatus Omnitrophota bacterium]|nr:MAG: LPS export ABC transporter periplasmic protein LptC [Candidatus Omnitrophota bacterium]
MIFKRLILVFALIFSIGNFSYALSQNSQDSEQQIMDFSLSGHEEKGQKSWEISGKSADIFSEIIKLNEVVGNLYGKEEEINLKADRGAFNKKEGRVHLEDNVVVTTSTGSRLATQSLDWDRKKEMVSTKDIVHIERDNMCTEAQGATAEPGLNKMTLERDVKVDILEEEGASGQAQALTNRIAITCDGPLEVDYEKNIAIFQNNVKVDSEDVVIYSDIMEVYFLTSQDRPPGKLESNSMMGTKIEKIIARGNVKIVRGENISYSDEAVYTAMDKKITLSGKPKLVIYSTEDLNAVFRD